MRRRRRRRPSGTTLHRDEDLWLCQARRRLDLELPNHRSLLDDPGLRTGHCDAPRVVAAAVSYVVPSA